MGIVVGDDVTIEQPWKRINRKAALENIEIYQTNSEFYQIADELNEMEAEDFLMGI